MDAKQARCPHDRQPRLLQVTLMNEKIKKILAIGVPILLFTALIISSFWGFGQKALADTYRESARS